MKHWTTKEISIFKENYVHGGTALVLEKLPHRTKSSITTLAKRLNLNLTPEAAKNVRIDNLSKSSKFVDYGTPI